MMSKNSLWVAILDDQMTVSTERNQTVFTISTNYGIGIGNCQNTSLKFWIDNDVLTIIESDNVWQFNYDSDYAIAEQAEIKLSTPQNIDVSIDGTRSEISLHWNYLYSYGNAGAVVEVKAADENEFDFIKTEHPYMNMYMVELKESNFTSWKNIIKIYHKGGPMLNATDKLVYRYIDSEPVFFEAIIDDNSIKINRI